MDLFANKLSDIMSALSGKSDLERHFNSVIIVAAGSGRRMGDELKNTKQLTSLCGIPVVIRSILQFEKCSFVDEIVVAAKEEEIGLYPQLLEQYGIKKVTKVVKGGDTRQKSVLEGFKVLSEKSEYVAIHDGARCLVTPEMIANVFSQSYVYGSAAAAEKSTDTVKKADGCTFIAETIDREYLWHAQTPQIFKTDIYRAATYIAQQNGYKVTDDCMLAENIGYKIKLVDCGRENIKLTTPADFYIAKAILEMREECGKSGEVKSYE